MLKSLFFLLVGIVALVVLLPMDWEKGAWHWVPVDIIFGLMLIANGVQGIRKKKADTGS